MLSTLRPRVIPLLILDRGRLVKTVQYKNPAYVGDPCNSARIFNEVGADELIVVDRGAARKKSPIDLKLIGSLASECFMPVSYGGGIESLDDAKRVFDQGIEKIIIGSAFHLQPDLVETIAAEFGRQAIIVAVDVVQNWRGKNRIGIRGSTQLINRTPIDACRLAERSGAGEIMLTDVEREGTWGGLNKDLIRQASKSVTIPVIGSGGAKNFDEVSSVIDGGCCSAVAVGSMVVFQKKNFGVLISFPEEKELDLLAQKTQSELVGGD